LLFKVTREQGKEKALQDGFAMNEDNLYYVNYSYQITLYEIRLELAEMGDAKDRAEASRNWQFLNRRANIVH
jgi:hypothetical protein